MTISAPTQKIEKTQEKTIAAEPRHLEWWEIRQLEEQGCSSDCWDSVTVSAHTDLSLIRNSHFGGEVAIGSDVLIRNVAGGIHNCRIGDGARVENVARIEFEPEAPCGVGTPVSALDETGSRPVAIYPGISSQTATLMARVPGWVEHKLAGYLPDFLERRGVRHEIGAGAVVRDCGRILNVSIGAGATVEGARNLKNGAIINNSEASRPLAYIGAGVDAENFIVEDGVVSGGAILRNCYVGQGAELDKGFTAHDSLFFANCSFENGEACAVLAGPYSVSMHKASLIIGCQTSFMNAGSATNQSNHMYKLGPVHWGVLERGVKTASGAYLMLGAKIGAFSMVMGLHKTHPDSSSFPFSYLFGDERGATVVVPGAMLRSCGLMRDEMKWPTRDRRLKRRLPLHDRINFNVLNPFTVDSMLKAIDTITELLAGQTYDDLYLRHKGMKFTRAALERAKFLYTSAIYKYLSIVLPDGKIPESDGEKAGEWVDLGGQVIMRDTLDEILELCSIEEAESLLDRAFGRYKEDEAKWISRRFSDVWRRHEAHIPEGAKQFDELVEEDRRDYLDNLLHETQMLSL